MTTTDTQPKGETPPDRIWVWTEGPHEWHDTKTADSDIEYVRADLLTTTSDSARLAAEEIALLEKPNHSNQFIPEPSCDICNAYRGRIAAIISKYFAAAPADNDAESVLPELLRVAAMLCQSGSNEPRVVLRFKELKDAQAVHQWLVKLVHQGDR